MRLRSAQIEHGQYSSLLGAGSQWVRIAVIAITMVLAPASAFAQKVLLVNDSFDQFGENQRYVEALATLGVTPAQWSVAQRGEPTFLSLVPYDVVVWLTGANRKSPGPSFFAEGQLRGYLENGGKLFMSSNRYHERSGLTKLLKDYLGVQRVSEGKGEYKKPKGAGLFAGLGPLNFDCSPNFPNANDALEPTGDALKAFTWNLDDLSGAVTRTTRDYKTVFFGFPFECIEHRGQRAAVMSRVLGYFGVPHDNGAGNSDVYEPNDSPEDATPAPIGLGAPRSQIHELTFEGDVDWFTFFATRSSSYRFVLRRVNGTNPIALELLDQDFQLVAPRSILNPPPDKEAVIVVEGLEGLHYLRMVRTDSPPPQLRAAAGQIGVQATTASTSGIADIVQLSGTQNSPYGAKASGRVLDAMSSLPIKAAIVTPLPQSKRQDCTAPDYTSVEPPPGEFEVACLINGAVMLHTEKVGYAPRDVEVTVALKGGDPIDIMLVPDFDGDKLGDDEDLDDDNDGIPDKDEITYGLDPKDAGDAAMDKDGDGFSNLSEHLAGTDPKDPKSNEKRRRIVLTIIQGIMME